LKNWTKLRQMQPNWLAKDTDSAFSRSRSHRSDAENHARWNGDSGNGSGRVARRRSWGVERLAVKHSGRRERGMETDSVGLTKSFISIQSVGLTVHHP
jgi:hypothetical protein